MENKVCIEKSDTFKVGDIIECDNGINLHIIGIVKNIEQDTKCIIIDSRGDMFLYKLSLNYITVKKLSDEDSIIWKLQHA
jgi:hypothetical protein